MIRVFLLLMLLFPAFAAAQESCISCHADSCVERREAFMCTSCHGGIAGTSREDIAHYRLTEGRYADFLTESPSVQRGAAAIDELLCRRCHTIGGRGMRMASNLDATIKRLTARQIDGNITAPNEQMPEFNLTSPDTAAVVTALLHYSAKQQGERLVEIVYFGGGSTARAYEDKCGGCHRMLSGGGALGSHTLAPFLSGLYSEFYPLLDGKPWDEKRLSDWLDNPRKIKPAAVMPVPVLKPEEKEDILKTFREEKP